MSYADAAGKGNQQGQQRRYFNDKMVVCNSRGIPLDKLVEALEENHLLQHDCNTESQVWGHVCLSFE